MALLDTNTLKNAGAIKSDTNLHKKPDPHPYKRLLCLYSTHNEVNGAYRYWYGTLIVTKKGKANWKTYVSFR